MARIRVERQRRQEQNPSERSMRVCCARSFHEIPIASRVLCAHACRFIARVRECKPHNHHIEFISTTSFTRTIVVTEVAIILFESIKECGLSRSSTRAAGGVGTWGLQMGRRRPADRTGRGRLAVRFRQHRAFGAYAPSQAAADGASIPSTSDRRHRSAKHAVACIGAPRDCSQCSAAIGTTASRINARGQEDFRAIDRGSRGRKAY